jgi:hypothetical protein
MSAPPHQTDQQEDVSEMLEIALQIELSLS